MWVLNSLDTSSIIRRLHNFCDFEAGSDCEFWIHSISASFFNAFKTFVIFKLLLKFIASKRAQFSKYWIWWKNLVITQWYWNSYLPKVLNIRNIEFDEKIWRLYSDIEIHSFQQDWIFEILNLMKKQVKMQWFWDL